MATSTAFKTAWTIMQVQTVLMSAASAGLLYTLWKRRRELLKRIDEKPAGSKSATRDKKRLRSLRWLQMNSSLIFLSQFVNTSYLWRNFTEEETKFCSARMKMLSAAYVVAVLSSLVVFFFRAEIALKQNSRLFTMVYSVTKLCMYVGGPVFLIADVTQISGQVLFNQYCTVVIPETWGILFIATYVLLSINFLFLFCYPLAIHLKSIKPDSSGILRPEFESLGRAFKRNFACSLVQILSSLIFQGLAVFYSDEKQMERADSVPENRLISLILFSLDLWFNLFAVLAMTDIWIPHRYWLLRKIFCHSVSHQVSPTST